MIFIKENKFNLISLFVMILIIISNIIDIFSNVFYTNWLRQNISWILPIIPIILLIFAVKEKENKILLVINILLILLHYSILYFFFGLAKAGAAVFRML